VAVPTNPQSLDAERARRESRAMASRLCEALGLDPSETTDIRLQLNPDGRATIAWSGCRRLTASETAAIVAGVLGVTS
jgi:hypothetical protein